ncbi:MobF family relaxase [Lewinella sp. LCG006]|uniref:MobF family relaxase n=1 Tax=Lewinella sp. LCG006 TaxID=3231911 RepID=UPI00345FE965
MLRITVSKGGKSAVNYFRDSLSQQDYYSERSQVLGVWHGALAERFSLPPTVVAEHFERLVSNRHPFTNSKITARDAANRRAGYDFTFNAPKSVSILEAMTGDDAIRKAHQTAISRAMQAVEHNMQTQMGQGKNKHYHTTGNLLYAAFEHDVTRPVEHEVNEETKFVPDPHLHTHCFVMNATWNEERHCYQAIEIGNIKKNAPYYQALYHCHLAQELQQAGYRVRRTRGSFEIEGISQNTIQKYSNRTREIEQAAEKRGLTWAEDKATLGAKTRHNKNWSVSQTEQTQHWQGRLTLQERFTIHSAKGKKEAVNGLAVEKKSDAGGGGLSPRLAIDLALQHYMERKSAVTEKQVLGYALKLGVDRLTPDAIQAELDSRKGQEVFTGSKNSDTYLTTKEALRAEEEMKAFAVSTRAQFEPINADYELQQDFLNEGQRYAVQHTLTSEDQVMIISGGAGVGKTTLMKEVKAGVEASGRKLYAFAPSADASRGVLRDKGFEEADTIKKLLDDQQLQERLRDQVILIDEAGMVGNQTMNGVFQIAKTQNARVILSGDWKQHSSVESGDSLRLLEQHTQVPVARVNEIVRQQDKSAYKEAVGLLADGEYEQGFDRLDQMGSVVEIEDHTERHERIASDYLRSIKAPAVREGNGKQVPRSAIVVSPTHAEGRAITTAIRTRLKEEGIVQGEERKLNVLRNLSFTEAEKQDHLNYQEGMRIKFHRNYQGFKAGGIYNVSSVDKDGTVMVADQATQKNTPLPFMAGNRYQVCQEEEIQLAQGDLIRITGNGQAREGQALNNGEGHTVKGFTPDGDIELSNGIILPKDYGSFTQGYYRTSHASQGKDAHDVLIAQSSTSFPASNEKQFYVSVSRGVKSCRIYTDDKQALKWAASQGADRLSATELLADQKAQIPTYLQWQRLHQYESYLKHTYSKPAKEKAYEPEFPVPQPRSRQDISIDL